MIQELLGSSASLLGGEGKISITGAVLQGSSTSNISPSSSPSSSSATAATTTASASATANTSSTGTASSEQQNLRCPRCDSSNTKFCYYNNYNLTQPRHFCKTCRRYWTKGGALRNVPIGGGCRKNKSTSSSVSAGKSSAATAGKVKSGSTDIIKSTLGFDHDPPSNPILWASPHNSQLLALLRATQNPNPNPHSVTVKEEEAIIGSPHMNSSSEALTSGLNARAIGVDPLGQVPIGLCSSSWRNNHQQHQHNHYHHQYQQQPHGLLLGGEVQNTGIHELYHRLRSSSSTYQTDHSGPAFLSNFASTSSTSPPILEPSPVAGGSGDLGCWNPAFSWSNLSTTNGAFP